MRGGPLNVLRSRFQQSLLAAMGVLSRLGIRAAKVGPASPSAQGGVGKAGVGQFTKADLQDLMKPKEKGPKGKSRWDGSRLTKLPDDPKKRLRVILAAWHTTAAKQAIFRQDCAAITLQSEVRGRTARKQHKKNIQTVKLRQDPRVDAAATSLQAEWRGHRTRHRLVDSTPRHNSGQAPEENRTTDSRWSSVGDAPAVAPASAPASATSATPAKRRSARESNADTGPACASTDEVERMKQELKELKEQNRRAEEQQRIQRERAERVEVAARKERAAAEARLNAISTAGGGESLRADDNVVLMRLARPLGLATEGDEGSLTKVSVQDMEASINNLIRQRDLLALQFRKFASKSLPPDWHAFVDPNYGVPYYVHSNGQTTWDRPIDKQSRLSPATRAAPARSTTAWTEWDVAALTPQTAASSPGPPPPSLRLWVERCYAQLREAPSSVKGKGQEWIQERIRAAANAGVLHSIEWDSEPIPTWRA